jgi:hypothetical protein
MPDSGGSAAAAAASAELGIEEPSQEGLPTAAIGRVGVTKVEKKSAMTRRVVHGFAVPAI